MPEEDKMNRKVIICSILAALLIFVCIIAITILHSNKDSYVIFKNEPIHYQNKIIKDVFTDKARYSPQENAEVVLNLYNSTNTIIKGNIYLQLKNLDDVVDQRLSKNVEVQPGEEKNISVIFELPEKDFQGYLLEVWYKNGSKFLDFNSTAIDVSSDWTKFPRYGYIASYPKQDTEKTGSIIRELNKFHLNGLQFYDWQYKHHQPVSGTPDNVNESWIEIANRKIYGKTVNDYIDYAHNHNMAAMNYNLLYGAWKDYEKDSVKPEWGLFMDKEGKQQDYHGLPDNWASNKIYLFDPFNTEWQNYLINMEKDVFKAFEFDGWHMDQIGERGTRYDYKGNKIDIAKSYAAFINKARQELGNKTLVFNAVNQLGQLNVAKETDVDFLYAEIWSTGSYGFLKQFIDEGFRYTDNKKSTVLAAYMNYRKQNGEFNEHSVRLTDAVIFAAGGSHIELGDTGMLSSEYFPSDKLKMTDSLKQAMRRYYDFLVAYQNFLRDGVESINKRIEIENVKAGSTVSSKTVWYFAKKKDNYEILHLINFLANSNNDWRDDSGSKSEPPVLRNLKLKYYTEDNYKKVMVMSPDFNNSRAEILQFSKGNDERGEYIEITISEFHYWDMIVFEKNN